MATLSLEDNLDLIDGGKDKEALTRRGSLRVSVLNRCHQVLVDAIMLVEIRAVLQILPTRGVESMAARVAGRA